MLLLSKNYVKVLLAFFLLTVVIKSASSQNFSPNSSFVSHWQIQVDGGSSLFFGDIKQYQWWPVYNYENEWLFAVGMQINKQLSPVFGLRAQGLYGQLAGTRRAWNKHFTNDYLEFNLNTTININNIFARYRNDRFLNAYVIFGLGLQNYNTRVYELGTNTLLQTVGEGNGKSFGGRTLEGVMIGGLGFDFRLSDRLSLNLETANRAMNSDMLDAHVNGFKYDVYNVTTMGLSYKFAYSKKRKKSDVPKEKEEKIQKSSNKTKGEIETVDYDYYERSEEPKEDKPKAVYFSPNFITEPIQDKNEVTEVEEIVEPVEEVVVVEEVTHPDFEYRVQIIAKYGKTMSIDYLRDLYNIPAGQIRQDTHNGFYIYSVGSFSTYEQAREKRNYLRTHNGIRDAFVVAFKNGNRLDKLP